MEDTTTVYYCIKDGKFLWGTERFEEADFEVKELSNIGKLLDLIKEKGLSKEDLTLILKTICLCEQFEAPNKVNVVVEVVGISVKSISFLQVGHVLLPVGTLTLLLQCGQVTSYVRLFKVDVACFLIEFSKFFILILKFADILISPFIRFQHCSADKNIITNLMVRSKKSSKEVRKIEKSKKKPWSVTKNTII